jgi:anthranilate synthase component I
MFKELSYERFVHLADSHQRIAVYKEIPGDKLTPINAHLALKGFAQEITLLESSPKEKTLGRYSYLCFDPIAVIKSYGKKITICHNKQTKTLLSDPFEILRAYQSKLFAKTDHPLSGFIGGMVGFMSYDAIRLIEEIPNNNKDEDNIPDMLFRCYNNNITFDHQTGKVILSTVANLKTNTDLKATYEQAITKINNICNQLLGHHNTTHESLKKSTKKITEIAVDIDDSAYREMVDTAKLNIAEGDIFQVVLSRNFSVDTTAKPFDIYRALRFTNPSPYMFYIEADDYVIAGASPEKLISIKDGVIESCPLAGTRPRTEGFDHAVAKELLENKKEVAEHMMLVDLSRNDIGAVAVPGSVKVTKLKNIEKYTRVMHISSTVQGLLRDDLDVFDAIKASFPAGTLSGAPKIRAMELIDELENTRRGIYGGVICGIDSESNLDSCIAIRTTLIKNGIASVRAGAGVVFHSEPQAEADETRHKAQAILEGVLLAEGQQS